jgi:hypothetical protein
MKTDGFGHALKPGVMYFVQDARQYLGNAVSLWGINGQGYTSDVNAAGLYTADQCAGMDRETDVPWPEAFVRKTADAVVTLDAQKLPPRPRKRAHLAGPRGVLP